MQGSGFKPRPPQKTKKKQLGLNLTEENFVGTKT